MNLYCEEFGSPKDSPVLILHGSGAPPAAMRGYAEALATTHRVLLPHRNGYSKTPPQPWSPSGEVDELAKLIDGEFSILGHSFGTYRAFQLAAAEPDRVDRVLALGPVAGLPEDARPAVEGLAAMIRSGADLSEAAAQRWVAPQYLASNPGFVDLCADWLAEVDPEILALENLEIVDGGRVMGLLARHAPDVRLYVGELDVATPPVLAQAIADAIGSDLQIVKGVGHSPMVEKFQHSLAWIKSNLDG